MKTVIIEDDFLIVSQIEECLVRLGHEVLASFDNASEALEFVETRRPDFVFMDIELRGSLDGLQCAALLQSKHALPSIFVTSHHETEVISEAMDVKPLNFLPKPFEDSHIEAVVALAQISLAKQTAVSDTITIGAFELNTHYQILKKGTQRLKLSDKELALVGLLFKNSGNIVSTDQIHKQVYQKDSASDEALRRLISRTREKLEGLEIKAVAKQGYFITTAKT